MLSMIFWLFACDEWPTLPSSDPLPEGNVAPGLKLPIRMRRSILPGVISGPPAPDVVITSDQCDDMQDGGGLADECMTAVIHCGETIVGHTRGGVRRYDTDFYESHFCTPATTQHDGGDERVYLLELPDEQTRAVVYLDTPCANLDLAAVKYDSPNCPVPGSVVPQCEMNVKDGTKRERVDLYNNTATRWWLVVEGQGTEEGAFGLTVQCLRW